MPLIEGVGDEVTIFFAVILLLTLIIVAWFSTYVADRPFVSVVILDRQRFQRFLRRLRDQNFQIVNINLPQFLNRQSSVENDASATSNSNEADTDNNADVGVGSASANANQGVNESSDNQSTSVGDDLNQDNNLDVETSNDVSPVGENQPSFGEEPYLSGGEIARNNSDTERMSTSEQILDTSPTSSSETELRRRRVNFFQKQTENSIHGQGSSYTSSYDANADISNVQIETTQHEGLATQPDCADTEATGPSLLGASTDTLTRDSSEVDLERMDGHIRVKVKFLNENQRWVQAKPEDTIGHFKREHFASEIADNMNVRLIFNGRELREEESTLISHRVVDMSVLHCFTTQNTRQSQNHQTQQAIVRTNELDIGSLMFPLFGLILVLIWYCRVTYRHYFTATSTFALLGITFLFMIAFMGSWRMHRVREYDN